MSRSAVVFVWLFAVARPAAGQTPYRVTWWDAASVGTAGALSLILVALDLRTAAGRSADSKQRAGARARPGEPPGQHGSVCDERASGALAARPPRPARPRAPPPGPG